MANNFKNIQALLGHDKQLVNSEDPNTVNFPAYNQMLENARRNYVQDVQAPTYIDAFRNRENALENKAVRSEPTVLDKIANSGVSKDFLSKLHDVNVLKGDTNPRENTAVDRTAINNEIIKSVLRDTNPSLAYRLDKQQDNLTPNEKEDNIKALYNEAEQMIGTSKPVPMTVNKPGEGNAAGVYRVKENTIELAPDSSRFPGHLGQFISTPFHERMHAQHNQSGVSSGGAEKMPDFSKSNKLSADMATAQSNHIPASVAGNIAPGNLNETLNPGQRAITANPGESGIYFKLLREMVNKPIPERE